MTSGDRWRHIRALQLLMTSGMNDWEARQAYAKQLAANNEQPIHRITMHRLIRRAHEDWARVSRQTLEEVRNRAIANRMRAQRLALTRTKPMVVDGVVERHADPDLDGYLKACEGLEEIHGLTDARRIETMRLVVESMFHELLSILREEIKEQGELLRIATRLRSVAESSMRVVVNGKLVDKATMKESRAIEGAVSVNINGDAKA